MGIFFDDDAPKRITEQEMEKVRSRLVGRGFKHQDLDEVMGVFNGSMNEDRPRDQGIDSHEIDRGVSWLRDNVGKHKLSSGEIDILEEEMKKKI